LSVTSHLINKL